MRQVTWLMMMAPIVLGVSACGGSGPDKAVVAAPAPATGVIAQVSQPTTPSLPPCEMLADASVALAVPGAQAGQPADEDASIGITGCRWPVGEGAVMLQVFDAGPGSLARELRSASLELVEIRKANAAAAVRIEQLEGIGDQAGAYVERLDSKRGIRKSSAVLMVQKGGHLAVLRIPQLADGDRTVALASMKKLGLEIATVL